MVPQPIGELGLLAPTGRSHLRNAEGCGSGEGEAAADPVGEGLARIVALRWGIIEPLNGKRGKESTEQPRDLDAPGFMALHFKSWRRTVEATLDV
ncbi:hypothetical protein TNIN_245001 [Trichonephila inaurata madagascariensis]|uniref:Uncharacterized protein n=1 Tax=Trichonephila inaurata madagascariensis TaxID=2747483 RepID=A0A8X7CFW9_9ARAC|nr:hypothetical protein TNIN_245001 [Trichonephila inaurata madagascariensis]